jgi:hypothetical protein
MRDTTEHIMSFVIQNFWNNANQHVVPDPFGVVK